MIAGAPGSQGRASDFCDALAASSPCREALGQQSVFASHLLACACRQCTQRTVPSSQEDRWDTKSTDAGSSGGDSAGSDKEEADWIFVADASEADFGP